MRGSSRKRYSLVDLLFEQMSQDDAAKAIEKGIVEPIENSEGKKKLEDVVTFLNSTEGKDATVRELLKMGEEDGQPTDEAIGVAPVAISPATNARPTQSQIGLPNSIGYAFSTKGMEKNSLQSAVGGNVDAQGIVAAGDGGNGTTFIVDGHHRWSSAIVVNPAVKLTVSMIQSDDPYKALAISQVVIASWQGPGKNVPSSTSEPDTNLLEMNAKEIAIYCLKNVGETLDPNASPFLSDDVVEYLSSIGYGGIKPDDDKKKKIKKICIQIGKNCKKVPKPGNAPPRALMPQFDAKVGGPDFKDVKSNFTAGDANFKSPVKAVGGTSGAEATAQAENFKRNDSAILERWNRLAGLIKD